LKKYPKNDDLNKLNKNDNFNEIEKLKNEIKRISQN
jgi:hypothetical protein